MEKTANSSTLRSNLSVVLDEVQFNMDSYIIERKGRPAAALVPLSVYENWKSSRQELIDLITSFQQSSGDNDPDEIMDLVLEAQQAVRREIAKEKNL